VEFYGNKLEKIRKPSFIAVITSQDWNDGPPEYEAGVILT
jgi:hypothetical protein